MKEIEFVNDCLLEEKRIKINTYELDNIENIKKRIIIESQHPIPFIYFKNDTLTTRRYLDVWECIESDLKKKTVKVRKLPGGRILKSKDRDQDNKKSLFQIWECIDINGYKISKFEILKLYYLYVLMTNKFYDERREGVGIMIISDISNIPFEEFGEIEHETKKYNTNSIKKYFENKLNYDWYENEKDRIEKKSNELKEENQKLVNFLQRFQKLQPQKTIKENDLGSIINVFANTSYTTGKIFDYLELNEEFPIANYKGFYKIWMDYKEKIDINEIPKDNTLKILDKEGNISIYIDNKEDEKLFIQSILTNNSQIRDNKSLIEFIKLQHVGELKEKSMGVIKEFTIVTKEIFDSSIFSNLCMNDSLFSRFLRVNDTDKISRNNHSVFLYYSEKNINKILKEEEREDEIMIYVGGWNRITSRYGELTAILTPLQTKDQRTIHVKITRSKNNNIVDKFKKIILKLITVYNEVLKSQIQIFKTLYPEFKPYEPPLSLYRKEENASTYLEPKIFTPFHYTRACQNPKPKIIKEKDSKNYKIDQKILFPPKEYKRFQLKPKLYVCDDKEYKYMGLIRLNNLKNPLGYAPCCYKETKLENKKIIEDLTYFIDNGYYKESLEEINIPSIFRKPLSTEKLINHIGQEGIVPKKILEFMIILEPSFIFVRVGTNTWRYDSLLGCLEYRHVFLQNQKKIPSPKEIRKKLLNFPLEVGMQDNFDIGMEGIHHILNNVNEIIEAKRFFRILEEYYNINLFIFKKININPTKEEYEIFQPYFYKEYYYSYWNQIKKRPIVFLIENSGENHPLRYELIGYRMKEKDKINFNFYCHDEYKNLLNKIYGTFKSDRRIQIPEERSISRCKKLITHQIIDIYGKVPMLILANFIPVLLLSFSTPFALPCYQDKIKFPKTSKLLQCFINPYKIDVKNIYRYKNYHIFHVEDFVDLFLISECDTELKTIELETKYHLLMKILLSLQNETFQFYQMKNNKRLIGIIENFCLYEFSKFVFTNRDKITIYTVSQIIENFFDLHINFLSFSDLGYSSISDFSTRFYPNPIYDHDNKLKIDQILRPKLSFFLNWFVINNSAIFENYRHNIELSSYYLYCSDFIIQPNHVIQNSIYQIKNRPSTFYQSESLYLLKEPLEQFFYYYNPSQTPVNKPYLCILFKNKNNGIRKIEYFLKYKTIQVPDDYFPSQYISLGQGRKLNDDKNQWFAESKEDPAFWMYSNPPIFIFLLNI